MSDVKPRWEIHIKQRSGKWSHWCHCDDEAQMRRVWDSMPLIRRKARLKQDGVVIAKYEPPEIRS